MSSIDWALQLGRHQDWLSQPWNAAGASISGALCSSLKGCIQGLFSPVLWELIEANLHLSLRSLLLHSLTLLAWAERKNLHFFNHYFLILFSRKNSSVPLHPLGLLLAAAVISTPAPKLKSPRSCQSHCTRPFPLMQVKIINIFLLQAFYHLPGFCPG